jgi:hypothetical protein
MGFLDSLINVDSQFKTAQDGRKLFFPGWPLGGYIIPSEVEYQRLRKQGKIASICQFTYLLLVIMEGLFIAILLEPIIYRLWFYSQCRHLEHSDERFSREFKLKPIELDTPDLWLIAILSIALAMAGMTGIYFFFIHRWDWKFLLLLALIIGTAVFGFVAIRSAKTLMVKSRQGKR